MRNEEPGSVKVFQSEVVWFIPLVIFLGFAVYKAAAVPLGDFSNYYFGAYFHAKGQLGSWLYDPALFNREIARSGFKGVYASYSPNPPAITLFFLPFTLLPPLVAKGGMNILGSLFFVIFAYRWFTVLGIDKKWALVIPLLFFRPIIANIYQGQLYFFLLILLVEGYLFFGKKQYVLASVLWGIAVFLKIFPLIIGLYLLATRKFRAFGCWVASMLSLLGISVGVQGSEVWTTFLTRILAKAQNGEVMENFAISFQSWNAGLEYLFVEDELMNPHPLIPDERGYWIVLLLIKAFLLSVSTRFCLRNGPTFSAFSAIVSCGQLLTPVGSVYSLVLWMVFLLNLLSYHSKKYRKTIQLCLLWLICNIPFHTFAGLPLLFQFTRLFLAFLLWLSFVEFSSFSCPLYGAFVLLLLPAHRKGFVESATKDASRYLLKNWQPGMLIGYRVENNRLVYEYWNEQGLRKSMTELDVASIDYQSVSVKENVLYYRGITLLRTPDEKKSPAVINHHMIIYLSDKNRGPGFYALRALPIP